MQTDFGNGFLIGEGVMTCSLTANPTQIDYDKSKMIISITPTKKFPSDTVFTISIPRYWSRSIINGTTYQIINATTQPNCLAISSNLQSNIGCTISGASMITVTVTNLLAT
jgi:hypothetical protein